MIIELELRTLMSRSDLSKALDIVVEATHRLSHRMSPAQIEKVFYSGISLMAAARNENDRRAPRIQARAGLFDKLENRNV